MNDDVLFLDEHGDAAPWDPKRFQTYDGRGTRWYIDTLPTCERGEQMTDKDKVLSFSALKPDKPFTKFVHMGRTSRKTGDPVKDPVPLPTYTALRWLHEQDKAYWRRLLVERHPDAVVAYYKAPGVMLDRASTRGTVTHAAMEHHLRGESVPQWIIDHPDAGVYVPHVLRWLDDEVDTVHVVEGTVFNRRQHYGGTGDMWVTLRHYDGVLAYGDLKTHDIDSSHGIYEENVAQGGAYTSADYLIGPSDDGTTAVRRDLPPAEIGFVLSARPDGVEVFFYGLNEATDVFRHMLEMRRSKLDMEAMYRKAIKLSLTRKIAPPPTAQPAGESSPAPAGYSAAPDASVPSVEQPAAGDADTRARVAASPAAQIAAPGASFPPVERLADAVGPASATIATTPDEGDTVDDDTVAALARRYATVDDAGRAWIGELARQAQQGHNGRNRVTSFRLRGEDGKPTLRRWCITAGLVVLAETGDENDEALRAILATIIGDVALMPAFKSGQLVASLSAGEAQLFERRCRAFVDGVPGHVDAGGALRLVFEEAA